MLIFASVCIPGALECRGLTQEANTVYISIMNQVRERNRKSKREGEREGGRKPFSLCCFHPFSAANPRGDFFLYSAFRFFFFLSFFPIFCLLSHFAEPDQTGCTGQNTLSAYLMCCVLHKVSTNLMRSFESVYSQQM